MYYHLHLINSEQKLLKINYAYFATGSASRIEENGTKHVDLTEILGIAGVPTFLFIHADGKTCHSSSSFIGDMILNIKINHKHTFSTVTIHVILAGITLQTLHDFKVITNV